MERSAIALGEGSLWRNAYPFFHSQCLYEGQRENDTAKRVCNLTRSAYLGQQRFGTVTWSGDVCGDWVTFRRQIPAGLNFCMAGLPYWTTDCGGFFRPHDQYASPDYNEMLARWFEWSTFCPILRIHGYKTHTEFWNWLPGTQRILADYDAFRYRMLPYIYSVAWQVTSADSTMMRALALDFREDAKALTIDDEYLFGPSLLVAPVTTPHADHRPVYLPKGSEWTDVWTGERHPGGTTVEASAPVERIPLFAKAGTIFPLGPVMEWHDQKPCDPLELRIYPGTDGSFTLYEDEGDGYGYEKGARATIPVSWKDKERTLILGDRKGAFPGMPLKYVFRIVLVTPGNGVGMGDAKGAKEISYSGSRISIAMKSRSQGATSAR
jgi:alpha-D-xyloside xylohydrolase